jgi:hypothetical protein
VCGHWLKFWTRPGQNARKMRAKHASSDRVVVQVVGCGWRVYADAVRACSLATRSGQRRGNLSCSMTASSRGCVIELMSVSHPCPSQCYTDATHPPRHWFGVLTLNEHTALLPCFYCLLVGHRVNLIGEHTDYCDGFVFPMVRARTRTHTHTHHTHTHTHTHTHMHAWHTTRL